MSLRRIAAMTPFCLLACSSTSPAPETNAPASLPVAISMELTVPAGKEMQICQFMPLPKVRSGESFVVGASHDYTVGSHHFIVYRTDVKKMEPGMEKQVDCGTGDADVMKHARGILYGAQVPKGTVTFPKGVGLQLTENEIVLFQSHYINASKNDLPAKVELKFDTTSIEGIKEEAGTLLFYDPYIYVGPHATGRASMRCPIPEDIHLITGFSHMHKRGVSYSAYLDTVTDGATGPVTTNASKPFYTSESWDQPQTVDAFDVKGGTSLRFECNYDNASGDRAYIQGLSAENNEMCAFAAIYWPRRDFNFEYCLQGRSIMSGTKSCSQTVTCLEACPAADAPKYSAAGVEVGQCWQQCYAEASAPAGESYYGVAICQQNNCGAECKSLGSETCKSCMSSKCAKENAACK